MPNIPKNATLRDLLSGLSDKDAFVSGVFGVAHRAAKERGEINVRMGVTGTGKFPNYRVEDAAGLPMYAINGANHERWPEGEEFSAPENWSTETMTNEEVKDLLAEVRNWQKR